MSWRFDYAFAKMVYMRSNSTFLWVAVAVTVGGWIILAFALLLLEPGQSLVLPSFPLIIIAVLLIRRELRRREACALRDGLSHRFDGALIIAARDMPTLSTLYALADQGQMISEPLERVRRHIALVASANTLSIWSRDFESFELLSLPWEGLLEVDTDGALGARTRAQNILTVLVAGSPNLSLRIAPIHLGARYPFANSSSATRVFAQELTDRRYEALQPK
jgi:hypothetical protein